MYRRARMYPQSKVTKVASCAFCGRVLGLQYYFTCHACGATYCYIHQWKHARVHKPIVTV